MPFALSLCTHRNTACLALSGTSSSITIVACPSGCSASCKMFETLSNALQWIASSKLHMRNISHVLADFQLLARDPGSWSSSAELISIHVRRYRHPSCPRQNCTADTGYHFPWFRASFNGYRPFPRARRECGTSIAPCQWVVQQRRMHGHFTRRSLSF